MPHATGRRLMIFLTLLALIAVLASPALAAPAANDPGPMIHLQAGSFDPLAGGPPDVPASLQAEPAKDGISYVLVQFQGPIEQSWPEDLRNLGAELLEYIPDYAYVVRLPANRLPAMADLPQVRWVGPWQPAYRLAPDLLALAALAAATEEGEESQQGEPIDLTLLSYPGIDLGVLLAGIARLGIEPGEPSLSAWGATLRVQATEDQVASLALLPGVQWIERFVPRQLANDRVQNNWLLQTAPIWNLLELYGQGQIVAVADSGLDTGNASTVHQDVRGRIAQAFALGRPGNWSDPNGHGTHVIGSLLGNGVRSGSNPDAHQYAGSAAGSAPEARLVLQSVMDASGGLGGLPLDLRNLFQPAYDAGARVHSNSWGAPVNGRYDADSVNVDRFLWDRKDMTILFAAGNEGMDANNNGVVDADSLYSPATAKNAIAVGASEGQRSSTVTWSAYGFTGAPLSGDLVSDNHWGMAGFSSRGPTDDNRIKPDLVAPGTNIRSLRSSLTSGSGDYVLLSGTSMSTPLTAGMAALVRQWHQQFRGVANPSGALVKATLLNGAMRIDPGQYGTGSAQEIPTAWPNTVAGWGRANLKHSIAPASPRGVWFMEHGGLTTNGSATYTLRHTPAQRSPAQLAEIAQDSAVEVVEAGSELAAGTAPTAASVNVQESTVRPGAIVTVQAAGFPANQPGTVKLDGATLGTLNENSSGSWTFRLFLNTELPDGSHTVSVTAGSTTASDTFQVTGGKDGTFRVTLAWTDFPGSTGASVQLVNDLDLTVSGPQGTVKGNNTDDRRNNVEEVWIQDAGPGTYTITVRGRNVPYGPQSFALVVSGDNLVQGPSTARSFLPLAMRK